MSARIAVLGGIAFALLAAFSFSPALARTLTPAEHQSLAEAVSKLATATQTKDLVSVVGAMPPKVIAVFAQQSQQTPDALRKQMSDQAATAMAQYKVDSFSTDLDHASYPATSSGVVAVVIPTKTVEEVGGHKLQSQSATLAILDGGAWYLLALSSPEQMPVIAQAYPELAKLTFPGGNTAAVK